MTTTRAFSDNRQRTATPLAVRCLRPRPRRVACWLTFLRATVLCCSTAAAVEVTYSLTLWIACLMDLSAVTTSPEMPLSDPISLVILSVACFA